MVIEPVAKPRRNVEQKFRCGELEAAQATALAAGAAQVETMGQRDVYFHASRGRLKLRWIESDVNGASCELIAYHRPDGDTERTCRYQIVPVSEPHRLAGLLAAVLGVRAMVVKRRRLLMSANLRIHLDTVEGLGSFVEFEAVLGPKAAEDQGRRQIARWRKLLGLTDAVRVSYVDLVERKAAAPLAPTAAVAANL